jgi:tRNA(His) guanylyltransferase
MSVVVSNSFYSRMCAKYEFEKPNDKRALDLMNAAAKAVVTDLPEITISYGVSDEYRYYSFFFCNSQYFMT